MHESIQAVAAFDRFARFMMMTIATMTTISRRLRCLPKNAASRRWNWCGTGRGPAAAGGCRPLGDRCRHQPGAAGARCGQLNQQGLASGVQLVEADLRTFDLPQKEFAFAFCTSNTLMHFATAAEQLVVLRNAACHLRPGCGLLVDLFNPDLPRLFAVDGLMELADRWQDVQTGAEVLKMERAHPGSGRTVPGDSVHLRRDFRSWGRPAHRLSLYPAFPMAQRSRVDAATGGPAGRRGVGRSQGAPTPVTANTLY